MRNLKIIAAVAIFILVGNLGRQIAACELGNMELRDDMKDMASQLGMHVGFSVPKSDEEFRNAVVSRAQKYDIQLTPEQVTVERSGEGRNERIYLATSYTVPIHLPGLSFPLHFDLEAGTKPEG